MAHGKHGLMRVGTVGEVYTPTQQVSHSIRHSKSVITPQVMPSLLVAEEKSDTASVATTNGKRLDQKVMTQILRDIPRTHRHDPLVRGRTESLRFLLLRYVAIDAEVNYCQGMNYVAAAFALAHYDEDEAYVHFDRFMRQVRGLWLPGFTMLEQGMVQFEALAESRTWFSHLSTHGVDPKMYLPQAWLSLFSLWLPLHTITHLTSFFEQHGFVGILAATLSILDLVEDWLLGKEGLENLMQALTLKQSLELQRRIPGIRVLFKNMLAWLPMVGAQMQRPSHTHVSFVSKAGLVRQDSCVINAQGEEVLNIDHIQSVDTSGEGFASIARLKQQAEAGRNVLRSVLKWGRSVTSPSDDV